MPFAKDVLSQGGLWELLSRMSSFGWFILIALLLMSLITWAIIFDKWRAFKAAEADGRNFQKTFRKRSSINEALTNCLSYKAAPMTRVFQEAYNEWQSLTNAKKGANRAGADGKIAQEELEVIDKVLERESSEQIMRMERNVAFLATTANAAPFIGLLGTCYGIMNAFMQIGQEGSASLVVVAPGIAEALIATIVGLTVAIPSVMAYNWASTKLKFFSDDLNNFSLEFLAAISKERS